MNALGKELIDRVASIVGLLVLSPVFAILLLLVWHRDGHSPFYVAERAARGGHSFRMVKIRSMVENADRIGSASTAADDRRVTPIGRFIRRWKIDELCQLWNVLVGDMSLVGPRPQVLSEVASYTEEERGLLCAKPGLTDFSSIVFADEADILESAADPNLTYRRLIRPWKSRLGLFYIEHASIWVDIQLIRLTIFRIFSRDNALARTSALLARLGAPFDLVRIARREVPLEPHPVPGMGEPFEV